jgi:hypothetical protein
VAIATWWVLRHVDHLRSLASDACIQECAAARRTWLRWPEVAPQCGNTGTQTYRPTCGPDHGRQDRWGRGFGCMVKRNAEPAQSLLMRSPPSAAAGGKTRGWDIVIPRPVV